MAANVLQLGEVAEIEAQMLSFAQKFNRRTAVEFSTEPAILPNCCCAFVLLLCRPFCRYSFEVNFVKPFIFPLFKVWNVIGRWFVFASVNFYN